MMTSSAQLPDGRVLATLIALARRCQEVSSLEDGLRLVTDCALETLACEHASIRLLDDARELVSWARSGTGNASLPVALRIGEGVAGWVAESGRPALVRDALSDPRFLRNEKQGFTIRSLVALPLFSGARVAGVLAATHALPDRFDERHVGVAQLLANTAQPMIERTRVEQASVPPRLEHALASPLRLRLIAELLEVGAPGLTLDELVVRSGRHRQDVAACLQPLLAWGVVAELADRRGYRLGPDASGEVLQTLQRAVAQGADQLGRERHVRNHLLGGMIGIDAKMQVVFEIVRQVARIDVPVVITGETGTGKELVARAVHDSSPRRNGFFGAVNCATLTESLFESQVFGHARGAFTGAVQPFTGLVERCHRGTLFLDEVGELSITNQVKLLRLLQEGKFTRLGETDVRHSDFRLISATNRDLSAMVAAGQFREDLYYRLSVFPIRIPSLRERLGDIPYLVEGILAAHAQRFRTGQLPTITPDAVGQLKRYHWPGNVRELENVMARAVVMAGGRPIGPEHLPEIELLSDSPRESSLPPDDTGRLRPLKCLADIERDHIVSVLRGQRGNISATATILGISRTTLYKKIREYGIDAPL